MDDLGKKIDGALADYPSGIKAVRIAELIGSTRTEVNSYLYKNKTGKYKYDEKKFTWRLSSWANSSSSKDKSNIKSSFSKEDLKQFEDEIFV